MEKFKPYSLEEAQNEAVKIKQAAIVSKKVRERKNYNPETEPTKEDYEIAEETFEFSEIENEKIREWAQRLVKSWHDEIKPNYIFFTETSALAYGYVIKETWRRAYPNEEPPRFFRINPAAPIIYRHGNNYNRILPNGDPAKIMDKEKADLALSEFLNQRITTDCPHIIIFDEGQPGYDKNGLEAIAQFSKNDQRIYYDLQDWQVSRDVWNARSTVKTSSSCGRVAEVLQKILEKKKANASIWTSKQAIQEKNLNDWEEPIAKRTYGGFMKINHKRFKQAMRDDGEENDIYHAGEIDEDLISVTLKDSDRRKVALKFIQDLKEIGGKAGEELRHKLREENGWNEWQNSDGKTIDEIERKSLEEK